MTHGTVAALAAAAVLSTALLATPAPPPVRTVAATEGPTSPSSTETRGADGSRLLTVFSGPVQLRRGAAWAPVDLTLVARPDGTIAPAASPQDLVLTPAGPTVAFAGGGSRTLVWSTPLPAPVLRGPTATYPQARPGYDLVVDATTAGFVASLRRSSLRRSGPAAPAGPPLALRGGTEAVAEPEAQLTEAQLTESTGGSAVSRVVAAAPVVGATPAPFDTTVQTTILRTDVSGDPDLRVGSYDGAAVARSYLTFDVSGVGPAPVTRAVLTLHQEWSASCRARGWEVWSSPAVGPATRWSNQPPAERRVAVSADTRGHDAACAAGPSSVDVTELVRSWAASGARSGTVALRAADEKDPLAWKRFGSAESANAPRLEITTS